MPVKEWSEEHRARFNATVARKRAERAAEAERARRVVTPPAPALPAFVSPTVAEPAPAPPDEALADAVAGIRGTVLRIEDRVALLQPSARDPQLVVAMQTVGRRLAALEASVAELRADRAEILRLLRRIDSRPPRVIEYRQSTRRQVDGGLPVRVQRKHVGLPKRARRNHAPRDPGVDSGRK